MRTLDADTLFISLESSFLRVEGPLTCKGKVFTSVDFNEYQYGTYWVSIVSFTTIEYCSDGTFQYHFTQCFDLEHVKNSKDESKINPKVFSGEFFSFMQDLLKEVYGESNVRIVNSIIIIKQSEIDMKVISELFTRKLTDEGYLFSVSELRKIPVYSEKSLHELNQSETHDLIRFII